MKSLLSMSLLIAFFAFATCEKPPDPPRPHHPHPTKTAIGDIPEDVPACILDEIRKMQAEPVANPPASIWQYQYREQVVYYIPPQCCDVPGRLLDQNCNQLCSPDGGLTGDGDGRCPDFFDRRTNEHLIWQDAR